MMTFEMMPCMNVLPSAPLSVHLFRGDPHESSQA